ncbi:hypothetical protein Q4603_05635 [Zobellia galactanivorans]|uniref:hypothetical protein n=1 Tax=Zobellia galactanivorans (strain DSM 12802 / CCUG 47099 / CIP 106680 / NCIMB 13871 / Dsij) TaxID=63186 RepID=UPI0026E2A214|nr:hypothetical protein [Zobellia galactanivorans]MDO6808076.1 hypothetical protein [Zobellia galactanivorans]
MMADRYILMIKNFSDVAMTAIGFLMLFSWSAVVAIIQITILLFYWLPTIYHKNVKRHHNGSWSAYFKDLLNIILNRYKSKKEEQ